MMSEVEKIAASLTEAQQAAFDKMSARAWLTCSEGGFTGMAATLLVCKGLVDRRWAYWGSDRVNGQMRGEGYEYRLNADGIALRQHLQDTTS